MKLLRIGLRFWITITSVVSFIGGWTMLANAPKPASSDPSGSGAFTNTNPLPTLVPLAPIAGFDNSQGGFQNQPLIQVQPRHNSNIFSQLFLTTGGS